MAHQWKSCRNNEEISDKEYAPRNFTVLKEHEEANYASINKAKKW
jgi:hypothetical protein